MPAITLGELNCCLEHWAKGGAKKDQQVQMCDSESDEPTSSKNEQYDESERNSRSRSL